MASRKQWGWIGLFGLVGLFAFASSAGADEGPGDTGEGEPPPPDGEGPLIGKVFEPTPQIGEVFKTPGQIVDDYLSPGNRTGTLVQIHAGDNLTSVARRALGVNAGSPATVPYIAAMTRVGWNRKLYGVRWMPEPGTGGGPGQPGGYGDPCTSHKIPRRYTVSEGAARWYLGDAFCKKHFPALSFLRQAQPVPRATDQNGRMAGNPQPRSFGVLWLPRVESVDPLVIPNVEPPLELANIMKGFY